MLVQPKLTIITPVFNGEVYLSETLESIVGSDFGIDFEYIVVNDGSKDRTGEILSHYRESVKVINQENAGESSAVNKGILEASGEFILVINADDPLLSGDLVKHSINLLSENSNLVATYPDWQKIDARGQVKSIFRLPEFTDNVFIGLNRCLPGPGVVFRRSAALKIGGRNLNWKYVGDYDFYLRLSRIGSFQRIPKVLAQWRESSISTSVSQRGLDMAKERIAVMESFVSTYPIDEKLGRVALANSLVMAARLSFFDSQIPGKALLIRSFTMRRGWPELATIPVVFYILMLPISRVLVDILRKFLGGIKWT
jgi:glycosyltransferase involved in cell wall biosynthesis